MASSAVPWWSAVVKETLPSSVWTAVCPPPRSMYRVPFGVVPPLATVISVPPSPHGRP
jgi:hypothetical protein